MDDPMGEDLERLLGPNPPENSQEKRKIIEEKLQFNKYTPDETPSEAVTHNYKNPAVLGYKEAGLHWGEYGWAPIDNSGPVSKYIEYVPTSEAIKTLVEHSPLVEVGAGNGYLSYVINENGGDSIATDINPSDTSADSYPTTSGGPDPNLQHTVWQSVKEMDSIEAIRAYPNRTVLMCHPSGTNRWAEETIDELETGDTFILVAEWFPGTDATPQFFEKLIDEWELMETFPILNWESTHARGYVFEKQ